MPTDKQKANLRRGAGLEASRKGHAVMMEVRADRKETAAAIIDAANVGDLLAAQRRVYGKLLAVAENLLDRTLRAKGEPPKVLVDVARELRQTADRVHELIEANSATAEAESFLASLDSKLGEVADRMAGSIRPY